MVRGYKGLILLVVFIMSGTLSAQTAPQERVLIPQEPANLGQLKTRLIAYHDCVPGHGCYTTELKRQSDLAIGILQRRVARKKPGEKLALVLDIDETALSNWDEEKQYDFGYVVSQWDDWVTKEKAPAIDGTLRLYNEALKDGVAVFFITGRRTDQETATADNLKIAGYHDWTGLALRGPHPDTETTSDYKSAERKKIVDAGYKMILNVGDQMSDFNGSSRAEVFVKLPDPFYFIP
jgi:predicted secreted acid phosphatase